MEVSVTLQLEHAPGPPARGLQRPVPRIRNRRGFAGDTVTVLFGNRMLWLHTADCNAAIAWLESELRTAFNAGIPGDRDSANAWLEVRLSRAIGLGLMVANADGKWLWVGPCPT